MDGALAVTMYFVSVQQTLTKYSNKGSDNQINTHKEIFRGLFSRTFFSKNKITIAVDRAGTYNFGEILKC